MHFCVAMIAIEGDQQQTVWRDFFKPVSWPEIEMLRHLHGEDAVTDVVPFVRVEQSHKAERDRLALLYTEKYIQEIWPGRAPKFDLEAPEAKIAYGMLWKNPLTNEEEEIELPPLPLDRAPKAKAA